MRLTIGILGAALLVAGPASACDEHGGGFFGRYSGYEGGDYGEILAMRARAEAEREQAMETARRSFLARFDIEAEAPSSLSAAAADKAELKRISNVDPSAPADAQDR
ncbi:MAG: hypothetical protein JNK30_18170 [Phenylobacterium sp.]|uniref:hypothetical protein n=1 Tax=Phenylobacterium sp. TaxID=1871053 RepID=UPI001A3D2AD1|nr:hypothetical protein [Phenylobacterium sp.]MBL8773315.1 hypothetical protein [Phenylobacterium sp.]